MTTQDFLAQMENGPFSDAVKAEVRALLAGVSEWTPQLSDAVRAVLQKELDADFADVTLDPAEEAKFEKELSDNLDALQREAEETVAKMEQEIRELDDAAKKIDVLERLHNPQA